LVTEAVLRPTLARRSCDLYGELIARTRKNLPDCRSESAAAWAQVRRTACNPLTTNFFARKSLSFHAAIGSDLTNDRKRAQVTKLMTAAAAAALILVSASTDQASAGKRLHVTVAPQGYVLGEPGARWGDMCWVPSGPFVANFYSYGWWAPCAD
jgi:hypothetical protein